MKRFVLPLALLAACAAFQAQAANNQPGDNPPPGLLAKIQLATQAHQDAGREFKDMKKFVRENAQASAPQAKTARGQARPGGTAIGGAIGGRAGDGNRDK